LGADGAIDAPPADPPADPPAKTSVESDPGRLLENILEDDGRVLQDQTEVEVKKSDLKTGKWLNFEIGVKEYDLVFDDAKGIFFVVNDEFGLDALAMGALTASGLDISQFASEWILGMNLMFLVMFFKIE
jgi:hypothetical protein